MARLLTNQIVTITEMREPHKVLERAGYQPVAILKNSKCIGYLVPEEAVSLEDVNAASSSELQMSLLRPSRDWLRFSNTFRTNNGIEAAER